MLKWKQSKKMEGNRRRSHLERHDLLRKIKGNFSGNNNNKMIMNKQMHSHFNQIGFVSEILYTVLCLIALAEFCKSILKDITERRSLSISINQFRNYCKNLDAPWFDHCFFCSFNNLNFMIFSVLC